MSIRRVQPIIGIFLSGILLACSVKTVVSPPESPEFLFTLGNTAYGTEEFIYHYQKSFGIEAFENNESPEEYLERFINFKLKILDAESKGLHLDEDFLREFEQYRRDLARPFLRDEESINALVVEAYERSKEDLAATHILIRVDQAASPADTLKVWNELMALRNRALAGEDFGALAKRYSQDPSAAQNNGYLGYFSSLQMVYPFETAAYALKPGEFSNPVRTRFGYHLIKLENRRPSKGEIKVAHILIRASEGMDEETLTSAQSKVEMLHELLQAGHSWDSLCMVYSEDITSRLSGGQLDWIKAGSLIPEFEDAAFGLQEPGNFAEPLRTVYGWHIIRLLEIRGIPSFEDQRSELEYKIRNDGRIRIASSAFYQKLKTELNFSENQVSKDLLMASADQSLMDAKWKFTGNNQLTKDVLFQTKVKTILLQDAIAFIETNQNRRSSGSPNAVMEELYQKFVEESLEEMYELELANINPEYRWLVQEYRDGLILFEIMEEEIWNPSLSDSLGLIAFFNNNREQYQWDERAEVLMYLTRETEIKSLLQELVLAMSADKERVKTTISEMLKTEYGSWIETKTGVFEIENHPYLRMADLRAGINQIDGPDGFAILFIENIIPSSPKELKETRGQVIADYQQYLDEKWVDQLRQRYPVKVDKDVFSKVKKSLVKN
jgi:peptidyl-prolyl cis-trans isomerase SurA